MKSENLFNAIGLVSDEKIIEADLYFGEKRSQRKHRRLKKTFFIAATVILLLLITQFIASAFGFNFFGFVLNWEKERLVVTYVPNESEPDEEFEPVFMTYEIFLNLPSEIRDLVPQKIMEDFKFYSAAMYIERKNRFEYSFGFVKHDDIYFNFFITKQIDSYIQKDDEYYEEYYINGKMYTIYKNINRYKAFWIENDVLYDMGGNISIEELKEIINSLTDYAPEPKADLEMFLPIYKRFDNFYDIPSNISDLVPQKIMDDFEFDGASVYITGKQKFSYSFKYTMQNDEYFSFYIDKGINSDIEKDDEYFEIYKVNDKEYSLYKNITRYKALWIENDVLYDMGGDVSVAELKEIIDSLSDYAPKPKANYEIEPDFEISETYQNSLYSNKSLSEIPDDMRALIPPVLAEKFPLRYAGSTFKGGDDWHYNFSFVDKYGNHMISYNIDSKFTSTGKEKPLYEPWGDITEYQYENTLFTIFTNFGGTSFYNAVWFNDDFEYVMFTEIADEQEFKNILNNIVFDPSEPKSTEKIFEPQFREYYGWDFEIIPDKVNAFMPEVTPNGFILYAVAVYAGSVDTFEYTFKYNHNGEIYFNFYVTNGTDKYLQKDDEYFETYKMNGREFSLYKNANQYKALWLEDGIIYNMGGDVALEELKEIINSFD